MPWQERSVMSLRTDMVRAVLEEGKSVSEVCRQYEISRKTAYKWLKRFMEGGTAALADRSRRPLHSPTRTGGAVERAVLSVRSAHKAWGGRKIARFLLNQGFDSVPAPSTITRILRRGGAIDDRASEKHKAFTRFCMESSNQLWQMDFKGPVRLADGTICHPLTVIDDSTRFLLGLRACLDQRWTTVRDELSQVFRRYGIPDRMLMDNGSPWGDAFDSPYTKLGVWLLHLGIAVSHGRPFHPQTQGKGERLHRTLKEELLAVGSFSDMAACQEGFDRWRDVYNRQRPHEAIGLMTPESVYEPSRKAFPEQLPTIVYDEEDQVRKVDASGKVYFGNRRFRVGKGFAGYLVAIRKTLDEGRFEVYFGDRKVKEIELGNDVKAARSVMSDRGAEPEPVATDERSAFMLSSEEVATGARGSTDTKTGCRKCNPCL